MYFSILRNYYYLSLLLLFVNIIIMFVMLHCHLFVYFYSVIIFECYAKSKACLCGPLVLFNRGFLLLSIIKLIHHLVIKIYNLTLRKFSTPTVFGSLVHFIIQFP